MVRLGKAGWLERLVREAVESHRVDASSPSWARASRLPTGRARARSHVKASLRESGLLYGTPAPASVVDDDAPPEARLYAAVLATLCRVALDVAVLVEAPPGPRAEQVLLVLASSIGRLDEAQAVHRRLVKPTKGPLVPTKLWREVEAALEARAGPLTADPYYGLVLHNGAVYVDAHLLGRVAIACFSRDDFPRAALERRLAFAAMQKALLVEVLVALVCAERPPGFPARRAILRQVDDLRLPSALASKTRAFARRAFERPVAMEALVAEVRSRDMKRFVLEQTLLASLVDGRRSAREVAWTKGLAKQLGFTLAEVKALELRTADFYARHRAVVDVFTVAPGMETMGDEWVERMSRVMRRNYRALLQEVRETGELGVLLARAARGQALTAAEKRAMREQLIDVAKAVPALAIFAAPGGLLLLLALAKVLPFDLLPSAFQDDGDGRPGGEGD